MHDVHVHVVSISEWGSTSDIPTKQAIVLYSFDIPTQPSKH
jgi:hypothetical protein